MNHRASRMTVLAMTVAFALGTGTAGQSPVRADVPVGLSITLPDRVVAGTTVAVLVSGATDGSDLSLTAITSAGAQVQQAVAGSGNTAFALGSDLTRAAGQITVLASVDGAAATGSVVVEAGPVVDPITPVVGARSIVANGTDQSMVVSLPQDSLGNVIAEDSVLEVVRRHPDGSATAEPVAVGHLLTWSLLPAGTRAGTNEVWLRAGQVTGPTMTLDEVAGPPRPFVLQPEDPALAAQTGADGHSLIRVRTGVLADGFGNQQQDGTMVTFDWLGPDGPSRSTAVTIAGVATVSIPAPDTPGTVTVTALCRGAATSAPLVLQFGSVVPRVPVTVIRSIAGGAADLTITVGPVTGPGGAYVPDGTVVDVVVTAGDSQSATASGQLVDGTVDLTLPSGALPGGVTVQATVLGTVGTTVIP